jgi:hypothetical protein
MAKDTFSNKHKVFRLEIIRKLIGKIVNSKKQSKFRTTNVLTVKGSNFNLDGNRYLVEVYEDGLIDNDGHSYGFNVLDTEQLCELADELL